MGYSRNRGFQNKPLPGAFIDWTHPASKNLLAGYVFNEGAGDELRDITFNNHHGAMTGFIPRDWTGSSMGGGLSFDATNNLVTVAGSYGLSAPITIEIIATMNDWASGDPAYRGLVHIGNTGLHTTEGNTSLPTNDSRRAFLFHDPGITLVATQRTDLIDGRRYHVFLTHPGGGINTTNTKIYIDGVKDTLEQLGSGSPNYNGDTLIGRNPESGGEFADCVMDKLFIYEEEFTQERINGLVADPWVNVIGAPSRQWGSSLAAVGGIRSSMMPLLGVG